MKKILFFVKKKYLLLIFAYIVSDILNRIKYRFNLISTESGTRHKEQSLEKSCKYIYEVFNDYKNISGLSAFYGKVAEVGTGDSDGVGLMFLLDGCKEVDLIDRFFSVRDKEYQNYILKSLIKKSQTGSCSSVSLQDLKKNLNRFYGPSAAAETFFSKHSGYNFIVSRAVFEHLYNPILALSLMIESSAQGGVLIHKVDLRDHGLFSINFHELKFLQPSKFIYKQMTKGSGRPNRVLLNQYVSFLEKSNLKFKIFITRLVGVGEIVPPMPWEKINKIEKGIAIDAVRSFRQYMSSEFSNVLDEDLAVSGFFMVVEKMEGE
jgi:hypothetical protein